MSKGVKDLCDLIKQLNELKQEYKRNRLTEASLSSWRDTRNQTMTSLGGESYHSFSSMERREREAGAADEYASDTITDEEIESLHLDKYKYGPLFLGEFEARYSQLAAVKNMFEKEYFPPKSFCKKLNEIEKCKIRVSCLKII
eukprot:UN29847